MNNFEKRRSKEKVVDLIANSCVDDLCSWIQSQGVNCYAFARGLTYPDVMHEYYAPGKLYNMKFGEGPFVRDEYNPEFIDKCIANDNIALNQNCTRVSFDKIKDDDGNFYFGITDFRVVPLGRNDHHWHFICRTETGLWLHKPNWYQEARIVKWIELGKTFEFETITKELVTTKPSFLHQKPVFVSCIGTCFEDYFYKLEFPED